MNNVDMSFLYHNEFKECFFKMYGPQDCTLPQTNTCKKGSVVRSRFFYIIDGQFTVSQHNKKDIIAQKGDILYFPPDCTYSSSWSDDSRKYYNINFILTDYNDEQIRFSDEICIIKKDTHDVFLPLFSEIYDLWIARKPCYILKCKAKFFNLLYVMANDDLKNKHKSIAQGIIYLESHYLDNISIDDIAKMCNISPSCFRRLFKEYSSLPPIQYRNLLRIKKAQELLKTGEYSVLDVAEAVNIPDVCYFSKLFKKLTGASPLNYKSNN